MSSGTARALDPLLALSGGVVTAAILGRFVTWTGPGWIRIALLAAGVTAGILAVRCHPGRRAVALWLLAGLALGGGRSLGARTDELALGRRLDSAADTVVRIRATVRQGWLPTRWGRRTTVRIHDATQRGERLGLPRSMGLEVRHTDAATELPGPGARIAALASIRGPDHRPFLVVASPRILDQVRAPSGIPRLREEVARALLRAAGTDPARIRAAELAAVLSVGRKDLMPRGLRETWRRSGLAHVLAVSGLHVGLVAGMVWLAVIAAGASPNRARLAVLVTVPAYAMMAGASPSALRAAGMVVIYVGARLLGRALLPMGAVLLTATVMLLIRPALVADAGFQLTVGITAALVRWVPPLSEALPLPRMLAGAVTVPVVAQLAAAPLVAWHFRTLLPGAVLTNLMVPFLLAPMLVAALGAAAGAVVWPPLAIPQLTVLGRVASLVLATGAPARDHLRVAPPVPLPLVALLALAGALGLTYRRLAGRAAAVWSATVILGGLWWMAGPSSGLRGPMLLPVRVGLAAVLPAPHGPLLVDGGRSPGEGAALLAATGIRHLGAVVATHADEDHVSGLPAVVEAFRPGVLALPRDMFADPDAVPVLRAARRSGARTVVLTAGLVTRVAGDRLETLWPPADPGPLDGNDRSLVARVTVPGGRVLLTSDVSTAVEHRLLAAPGLLASDVLVVGHHGSRRSTSRAFLAAVAPRVALVPAGPGNTHHHPHPATLRRLEAAGVPWRAPIVHGPCGAERWGNRWRPFP